MIDPMLTTRLSIGHPRILGTADDYNSFGDLLMAQYVYHYITTDHIITTWHTVI